MPGARGLGTCRASGYLETPGGKGLHVAAVAAALGALVRVVLPLGGRCGEHVRELADQAGIELDVVEIAAETRGTYTVVDDADGAVIEVLEPPPTLSDAEVSALVARAHAHADATVLVVTGSVPRGVTATFHADVARRATGTCLVDASGDALAAAISDTRALVKPNRGEAERATGRVVGELALSRIAALVRAPCWISLGEQGSLFVPDNDEAWHLSLEPRSPTVNTVGCGDALAGGFAAGIAAGRSPLGAAALGVAAATSKATHLHPATIDAEAALARAGDVVCTRIPIDDTARSTE